MKAPSLPFTARSTEKFRGMMPILPTTIDQRGELEMESQRRLIRYALACDAVSIGHMGMASEAFKLTRSERNRVIEETLSEVARRVPVFIGVTAPSTRIAEEYARDAEKLGADLLMLALPYVTVPDLADACDYVRRVCGAVSIPVILQDTAVSENLFTPEVVLDLFAEVPNLHSFKADGRNFLPKTARLLELTNGEIEVIGGLGGKHMIHMLRLGISSFMTGTEALDLHASLVYAYLAGDHGRADRIFYHEIMPYFAFYEQYPDELLKRMLHWRGLIAHPAVIQPAVPVKMSETEWSEFEKILRNLAWRRQWSDLETTEPQLSAAI